MTPKKQISTMRKLFWGALVLGLGLPLLVAGLLAQRASNVRLPAELLKAPIEAPPPPREAPPADRPAPPPIDSAALMQIASYEDFLKLAQPEQDGAAALWAQIEERFEKEEIYKQIDEVFYQAANFKGTLDEPFTPAQAQWLKGQAELLGLIRRYAQIKELRAPSLAQRQQYAQTAGKPFPVPQFLPRQTCAKLLAWNARLKLQEGEYEQAAASLRDGISLAAQTHANAELINQLIMYAQVAIINWPVRCWVQDAAAPVAPLRALLPELERAGPILLPPDLANRIVTEEYLVHRAWLVGQITQGSWRSEAFGWQTERAEQYKTDLNLLGVKRIKVYTPEGFFMMAFAMYNRGNSAEALAEYDRVNKEIIKTACGNFSEIKNQFTDLNKFTEDIHYYFAKASIPNWLEVATRKLAAEARMSLNVAGGHLRLDRKAMLAAREGAHTSPTLARLWRDPFTERPLQHNAPTTPTLVWSLGPDLADQHGQVAYDPTNGALSAGDLSILVP